MRGDQMMEMMGPGWPPTAMDVWHRQMAAWHDRMAGPHGQAEVLEGMALQNRAAV